MDFSQLKFDANGLIPAIAQDARTNQVLMLAYMNQQSIEQTLETGYATYFSRSRQALWKKGETTPFSSVPPLGRAKPPCWWSGLSRLSAKARR